MVHRTQVVAAHSALGVAKTVRVPILPEAHMEAALAGEASIPFSCIYHHLPHPFLHCVPEEGVHVDRGNGPILEDPVDHPGACVRGVGEDDFPGTCG